MFYRIFYTSWPQLLEAGRGGFGIVARHREIPTVISHAAEAASQFAPLRGEAVHRVVYAYRTETAQSGRWHILSRIEDSGSDYTGRTNYLAQHLVASDEVARSLASQGISPAMVMGAPDAWPGFDGQVGFITDPPWQVGQAPPREGYWAGFGDGNADRRFLLAAGSNVTFVYLPHWQDSGAAGFILGLYDEAACGLGAECGWGTTFTTYLEPTDKLQDFCWIGLPADSALLPKLRDAGRAIITETTPPPARPVAAVISPSNKGPVSLLVGEGGAGTNPSSAAALQRQRSPGSLRGGGPLQPTNPTNTKTAPLTSSEPSWPKRVWGQHKWRLCAGAVGVCIAVIAWWLYSSAMSSSQPHSSESLKVTYGEFSSEAVQRFLKERGVLRVAELQFSEEEQEQWRSQVPQDAGSYKIRRISKRWLPMLPNKERTLPYTLIIAKKTPVIEWTGPLSFEYDLESKPVFPTITPEEAAANPIIEYKRLDKSDEKWSEVAPATIGEHQVRVVIPDTRNFAAITNVTTLHIKDEDSKEAGVDQEASGQSPNAPPGTVAIAGGIDANPPIVYLGLAVDALSEADSAKIWPRDLKKFTREDWSKEGSPEDIINETGGLGDDKVTQMYEMNGKRFPAEILDRYKTEYSEAPHIYTAEDTSGKVQLIGLRTSNDNRLAVRRFLKGKISVKQINEGKELELFDQSEFFKQVKLLPEDSQWILRINRSQSGGTDNVLILTNEVVPVFNLQTKLLGFEKKKKEAEELIKLAKQHKDQTANINSFFTTNKQLLIDELERLDPNNKRVATSLLESLQKIPPPPAGDGKGSSDVETITELLIAALDRAFRDQTLGRWMAFSERERNKFNEERDRAAQGATQPGIPWPKIKSFNLLNPQDLKAWLAENPSKGGSVSSVQASSYEWLQDRIKNLTKPEDAPDVPKTAVEYVLKTLANGIRQTGVSGQGGVDLPPPIDESKANEAKAQAVKDLDFLRSLGTTSAIGTGSAELLIEFPGQSESNGPRRVLLISDVALSP